MDFICDAKLSNTHLILFFAVDFLLLIIVIKYFLVIRYMLTSQSHKSIAFLSSPHSIGAALSKKEAHNGPA